MFKTRVPKSSMANEDKKRSLKEKIQINNELIEKLSLSLIEMVGIIEKQNNELKQIKSNKLKYQKMFKQMKKLEESHDKLVEKYYELKTEIEKNKKKKIKLEQELQQLGA